MKKVLPGLSKKRPLKSERERGKEREREREREGKRERGKEREKGYATNWSVAVRNPTIFFSFVPTLFV